MAMTVQVNIVSAEEFIYAGEAQMLYAPGSQGELGISPRHAPLLTALKPGEVRVQDEKGEKSFFISGGMLEVQPDVITILADTAIRANDLDEAKAMAAKEAAEKVMAEHKDDVNYAEAVGELQQAMAQLEAISRLRKRSGARH